MTAKCRSYAAEIARIRNAVPEPQLADGSAAPTAESAAHGDAGPDAAQLVQRLAAAKVSLEAALAQAQQAHEEEVARLRRELADVQRATQAAQAATQQQLASAQLELVQSRAWMLKVRAVASSPPRGRMPGRPALTRPGPCA